ncbi:MAG: type II toxin-antitoxin system death-on-curing family toxin [bacterium]|nr:type II toxin-antitoxin system death-on-curing family toxin [bacterium]
MKNANFNSLDIDQVLFIHERIIEFAGGKQGIRDFTLLHSALERCKATYAGEDLYPTTFDKAAALLHSLVMNHAFLDGNKRTAYAIMTRFLNQNGFNITAPQTEIVRFCIAVDNDGLKGKEISEWLEKYCLLT